MLFSIIISIKLNLLTLSINAVHSNRVITNKNNIQCKKQYILH